MARRLRVLPTALVVFAACAAFSTDWGDKVFTKPEPTKEVQAAPAAIYPAQDKLEVAEIGKPTYYDISLSHDLQNHTRIICEEYGVPTELALAVMAVESSYQADAYYKDCYGLMQIHKVNHARLTDKLGLVDITQPEDNITAGVYMLSELLYEYGDMHQACMAYNAGEAGAKRLWKQGTYSTGYSRKVLGIYEDLREETA